MIIADRLDRLHLELVTLRDSYRRDQVYWFALDLAAAAALCARDVCANGAFDPSTVRQSLDAIEDVWIGRA